MKYLLRFLDAIAQGVVLAFSATIREVPRQQQLAIMVCVVVPHAMLLAYLLHLVLELGTDHVRQSRILGVIAMTAILFAGWGLYWLREHRRFIYGCLELSAAMATAYSAVVVQLSSSQERLPILLAYLGALYIAVRGYDNLTKAMNELRRA